MRHAATSTHYAAAASAGAGAAVDGDVPMAQDSPASPAEGKCEL